LKNQLDSIFLGVPPAKGRNLFGEILRQHHFEKYYFPCAGRFAAIQTAVQAGVDPKKIYASDISLFSTLLGSYFSGKGFASIKIGFNHLPFLADTEASEINNLAETLLAIKFCQLPDNNYYNQEVRKELSYNKEEHKQHLIKQIEEHKKLLNGIHYEVADIRKCLNMPTVDPNNLIYINPPGTSKGYDKMFDFGDKIEWNEPSIANLEPKEFLEILEQIASVRATVIVNLTVDKIPKGWFKLFAQEKGEFNNRLICNKNLKINKIYTQRTPLEKLKYPLYDGHDITKHSQIKVIRIGKNQAGYYRDLFIHRLGTTSSELTVGLLIDNQLLSVVGLNATFLMMLS